MLQLRRDGERNDAPRPVVLVKIVSVSLGYRPCSVYSNSGWTDTFERFAREAGNGIVAPKKMKGRYHSLETLTCNQALFSSGGSGAEL